MEEARKIIRRVLYDFNLDVEGNRDVYGEIQHSYSAFLKTKVDGEIIYRQQKNELIVDLSCRNNVTGVAILLGILCWPLLIVGAIVLPNQGKQEFEREMREACRALEHRLRPQR